MGKKYIDFAEKEKIIKSFIGFGNFKKSDLIIVLHRTQQEFGYIPPVIQVEIAERLDVPLAEVNGVVSFYSYFTNSPKGIYSINVCMGTACYVKGSQKIFEKFVAELDIAIGETSQDGLFTLESCRCIGACGLAPVVTINEDVHGQLTEKDVVGLIETYRMKGGKEQ